MRAIVATLFFLLPILFIINISLGSVAIPMIDTITALYSGILDGDPHTYIILEYRVPKAITACLVGSGLALSGLLMQTLFRNPLAGPFVLGISSGASLGAALWIMGFSSGLAYLGLTVFQQYGLITFAVLGSLMVLLVVVLVATKIKDTMSLLIIGLMFGSFTAAIVSVLSYFANKSELTKYVYWTFGGIGGLSWKQIALLSAVVVAGSLLATTTIKALNGYLLGENYAKSMGVNITRSRYVIIISTGILAGGITAFAGPIAFVGLAVPHVTRQLLNTTDHKILLPMVMVTGAIVLLFCDIVAQLPGSVHVLPINAITTLFGAPIVIWLIMNKRKVIF